jgi:hypothetical protein
MYKIQSITGLYAALNDIEIRPLKMTKSRRDASDLLAHHVFSQVRGLLVYQSRVLYIISKTVSTLELTVNASSPM